MDAVLAPLSNADGSCELRRGKARILCAVTGPGDIPSSKRLFDRANILFSINRLATRNRKELIATIRTTVGLSSGSGTIAQPSDRLICSIVEASIDLDAYPRTGIQICTQELGVDGPSDAHQLNGICLALLDAGVRMRHVFGAVTVALTDGTEEGGHENTRFVLDPDQVQAAASKALFTFVFRPSVILAGKLIGAHSSGQFSIEEHKKALELAERNCLPLFDFYRRKVQEKFIYQIRTS